MSQEYVPVPRLRIVSGLREIMIGLLAITAGFGIGLSVMAVSKGGRVHEVLVDPNFVSGGAMYVSLLLGLAALALTRPTVTLVPAGVIRSTLWLELRARSGASRLPATVILWPELRRIGLELRFRSFGALVCELTLAAEAAAIGINIGDALALPMVDAVLARRPDLEVEPATTLVLAALRRQSPQAVGFALERAVCRFAKDRGIYRRLPVRRHWLDEILRSPELRRDFVADLGKYFP